MIRSRVMLAVMALVGAIAAGVTLQPEPAAPGMARFMAFDVGVDPLGVPLAAYQVEVAPVEGARVRIVGVEGGEAGPYAEAPYYDPLAIQGERVIIGAFSTLDGERLPSGASRVARVHVMVESEHETPLAARLMVAGRVDGGPIDARVTLTRSRFDPNTVPGEGGSR